MSLSDCVGEAGMEKGLWQLLGLAAFLHAHLERLVYSLMYSL